MCVCVKIVVLNNEISTKFEHLKKLDMIIFVEFMFCFFIAFHLNFFGREKSVNRSIFSREKRTKKIFFLFHFIKSMIYNYQPKKKKMGKFLSTSKLLSISSIITWWWYWSTKKKWPFFDETMQKKSLINPLCLFWLNVSIIDQSNE